MSEFIAYLVIFILWLSAVIHDATEDNVAWLIADILVFPIGLFRGIYLLFGGG